jgi:MoaA/NifB/PqqE/SkfB family radical SAM enzyme
MVSWLGGEPLLWAPLPELTRYFHNDLGLHLSTTTNGTTLRQSEVREHLAAHYRELTVSVDAIGGAHDRLRGWPGGFAGIRDGVKALARERGSAALKLRANVVLMRATITAFPELCEELATWGIDEITFNQLGGRDRPEFFPANRLLPAQVDALRAELPDLAKRLAARGVRLAGGDAYLDRFAASARGEPWRVDDCRAGERFLFIDERGFAAPCSFTAEECGIPIAEITSADALRSLPAEFARRRMARLPAACRDCHSTQVFAKFAA